MRRPGSQWDGASNDLPLFRPGISPVGVNRASVMRCPGAAACGWSLPCCHRCCHPRRQRLGDHATDLRVVREPDIRPGLSAPPGTFPPAPGACVPPLPHRTDWCRSIRRSGGVKDRLACTLTRHLPPVLVAPRKHRSLMPQRRRITIRRQSGGALCSFLGHVAVDQVVPVKPGVRVLPIGHVHGSGGRLCDLANLCSACVDSTAHRLGGRYHSVYIPDHGNCPVTARTLQGMARVRSGQAPAWPLVSDRSVRRGSGVKRDFACTFTRHFPPVLVVLRSQSCLRLEGRTRTLSGPSPDLALRWEDLFPFPLPSGFFEYLGLAGCLWCLTPCYGNDFR